MGLFADLVEEDRRQRAGRPVEAAPQQAATLGTAEPPAPPPSTIQPPSGLRIALHRSGIPQILDLAASGARAVGSLLSIPREATTDPLSRVATALTVGKQAPVITPEGRERPITAPELLMEGLRPDRRAGSRATSEDYRRASQESIGAAVNQGLLTAIGLSPEVLGSAGDLDRFVAEHPEWARRARLAEDVVGVPLGLLASVISDPASLAGGSSVARGLSSSARVRAAGAAADRAFAKAGVALGASGTVEGARKTAKAVEKGDTDEAIVGAVETLASGGLTALAGKGVRDLKRAGSAARDAVDTGRKYKFDPKLTAEERATLEAEEAAQRSTADAAIRAETDTALADVLATPPDVGVKPPSTGRAFVSDSTAPETAPAPPPETRRAALPPKFGGDPTKGGLRDPVTSHEFISEGKPVAELTVLRDRLADKLSRGTLTDTEARTLLRINDAIAYRERELSAAAQVRAAAAVDPRARAISGVEAEPLDTSPRLSEGEVQSLLETATRSTAPQAPRLPPSNKALLVDRLRGQAQGPERSVVVPVRTPNAAVRVSPRAGEVAASLGGALPDIPTVAGVGRERLTLGRRAAREALQARLQQAIKSKRQVSGRALASQEVAAAQARTVAEYDAGVGEGHGASVRIGDRALTLQDAETHIERLPKSGQELAGRYRAAVEEHEVVAGRLQAADRQALAPLGDRVDPAVYEPVAQALDGKADAAALSPAQQEVYKGQRAVLNDAIKTYNEARQSAGLEPIKVEENYWPRVPKGENLLDIEQQAMERARLRGVPLEDAMRELRGSDLVAASRADRKGAFEQTRTGDLADVRYDAAVIPEYIEVLARRTAELRHYGKNGEALSRLIAQLPDGPKSTLGLKVGDREFAQRFFDRIRNVSPAGFGTQVGHVVRSLSGAHDLVWAAASQPLSYAQTSAVAGVAPTIKGVLRAAGVEARAADLLRPRQLAAKARRAARAAGIDAERVAAVSRHVTEDLLQATSGTGAAPTTVVGKVQRLSNRAYWIRAMLAVDRFGRIAAVQTWRAVGPEMIAKAKAGSQAEQANLARIGIDWKSIDPTDTAAMDLAAKRFSDATQYRARAGKLPPWASSPIGRTAFQYLSFSHQHTKTVRWMAGEAAKGNLKPVARFAAVGIPVAVLSREFIDTMRGIGWDEEEVTADNVMRKLKEALSGRARVNPTKGPYAAAVYAARIGSMLGVGMVYQSLLERVGGGDIYDVVPAGKFARSAFNAASKNLQAAGARAAVAASTDETRPAAEAAADRATAAAGEAVGRLAGTIVPPVPGADVVRELTTDKPARPLLAGRVRDFLEDRHILPVSDESTRGVEGRKRIADLKRLEEENKRSSELLAASQTAPEKATVAERLSKAEKSQIVTQLKLAYAEAIRNNDSAARERVITAFRALRLPFSRKARATLERRTIVPLDEEE